MFTVIYYKNGKREEREFSEINNAFKKYDEVISNSEAVGMGILDTENKVLLIKKVKVAEGKTEVLIREKVILLQELGYQFERVVKWVDEKQQPRSRKLAK